MNKNTKYFHFRPSFFYKIYIYSLTIYNLFRYCWNKSAIHWFLRNLIFKFIDELIGAKWQKLKKFDESFLFLMLSAIYSDKNIIKCINTNF